MALVYMITFPNGKRYIGITSQSLDQRRAEHLSRSRTSRQCFYVHNALFKYEDAQWHVVQDSLTVEQAKELEKEYIKMYKTNNRQFGYNLTAGGDGITGKKFTPEQLKKLSDSHKGIKQSRETVEKRMSKIRGKLHRDARPIVGRNITTNEMVRYPSLTKIKHEGKFSFTCVDKCCKGIRKTHAGYVWNYEVLNV